MDWKQLIAEIGEKTRRTIPLLGGKNPHVAVNGVYDNMPVDWWTTGFWPGLNWILYDQTGDTAFRDAAWGWDVRLAEALPTGDDFHHDVGFQFLPTAVAKYVRTGDGDAQRRARCAAAFLAGRFNPAGNFIRAWNGPGNNGKMIVDCCMNLSLLFWAALEFENPAYYGIATRHLDTVLAHQLRADGSAKHIVEFDPVTGEYLGSLSGQGYSETSAWSRGQAWAIYGITNAWRYTGEERYLAAAKRTANYFIAALPDDSIPYWDFRLPSLAGEPRDTSAAACAASGLFDLAEQVPPDEAAPYRAASERIMAALWEICALLGEESEGLLGGGTGHKPANSNVNVPLIYGDYFFVEAAAKLAGWKKRIF